MTKVGLLGGTFDPVHFGHLNLAIALKEAASLDRVLLVPARTSPFKMEKAPIVSGEHRLEMLRMAIEGIEGFEMLDWELKKPAPSYTIDTVRQLSQDPSLELHLLLTEDQIPTFSSWKESALLIQLASPLIGMRSKEKNSSVCSWGKRVQMPCLEISSTLIRERLARRAYCGHLLPLPVLKYIQHHQLYVSDDN
jgi:nicotinate-nucleotide adenylyltransferase